MVSFDHRDPGTPEEDWSETFAEHQFADFEASCRALVVVAAHPDDETLGAGGLIAQTRAAGGSVTVVVATDGEGSHPHSPTRTPRELAAVRREELVAAVDALAPGARIVFLGIPDGALRENTETLASGLSAAVHSTGSEPVDTLVVAPWTADGHRDHRIAGVVSEAVAAEAGARYAGYPIWFWHWARPGDLPRGDLRLLSLTDDARSTKRLAMRAHASQVEPLSSNEGDSAVVGPRMLEHFDREFETFVLAAPGASEGGGGDSLGSDFFTDFYADRDDPWGFETRWYEERKRAITVASLPRPLYRSALEVGCSTGALTQFLAGRAERILGVDIAEKPLVRARERLDDVPSAAFARMDVPGEWPTEEFDLVVLSEVGYYWSPADLERALAHVDESLTPDGHLLACHWRHPVAEYPSNGDDVHARIRRSPGLTRLASHVEEDFVLEVFGRSGARSVARETGLLP